MKLHNQRRRRGFTLIELLIVILILAILMAIALPLYLDAVSRADVTVCRANMQSVAHAEQAYRTRNAPTYQYTTNFSDLIGDLAGNPLCPQGGVYSVVISDGSQTANSGMTVPAGGLIVQCTASGHGVFAPGIDSE